jgi:hypothetical protein
MLLSVCLFAALGVIADDEKVDRGANIEGRWEISEATNIDGSAYSGTVTITEDEGIYILEWESESGNYPGLGLRYDNDLFVGWGAEESGIVVYEIAANGVLEGDWTSPGQGDIGSERLSPTQNADQLPGRYNIIGTNTDGSQYTGTMLIEQNGDVYQLTWGGNAGPATGVGMRVGDRLIVGYAAPAGGNGVLHYHFDGDTAAGSWTIDDAETLATENLTRER